jgi:hypothetical protein
MEPCAVKTGGGGLHRKSLQLACSDRGVSVSTIAERALNEPRNLTSTLSRAQPSGFVFCVTAHPGAATAKQLIFQRRDAAHPDWERDKLQPHFNPSDTSITTLKITTNKREENNDQRRLKNLSNGVSRLMRTFPADDKVI